MNGDPMLDRVSRANPAREEQFSPDPRGAAHLRSGAPASGSRRPVRWRSVLATVAGIAAIGALIAVLPRGNDAATPSLDGQRGPGGATTSGRLAPGATAEVSVWIAADATPAAIDALRARLDGLVASGAAASVTYISAEDALAELRGRLKDPSILDELPSNPMPGSFRVLTSDAAAVQATVAGDPAIDADLGTTAMPGRATP